MEISIYSNKSNFNVHKPTPVIERKKVISTVYCDSSKIYKYNVFSSKVDSVK